MLRVFYDREGPWFAVALRVELRVGVSLLEDFGDLVKFGFRV